MFIDSLTIDATNGDLVDAYASLDKDLEVRSMAPLPIIEVRWSIRMSNRRYGATYATRRDGRLYPLRIVLNKKIFTERWWGSKEEASIHLQGTLRHEAAHAWTCANAGRLDHSKAWQHIASILGDTGKQYAGCSAVDETRAVAARGEVPTQHDNLDRKQVHSMRTSFAIICRKYNLHKTYENFDKYIRPRFPHFSTEAINKARDIICGKG